MLNPAVNPGSENIEAGVAIGLLSIQSILMLYLLKVSFGKLKLIVRQSKARVQHEQQVRKKAKEMGKLPRMWDTVVQQLVGACKLRCCCPIALASRLSLWDHSRLTLNRVKTLSEKNVF